MSSDFEGANKTALRVPHHSIYAAEDRTQAASFSTSSGLSGRFEHAMRGNLNKAGYKSGPAGLVTCAHSSAVVAVKIFVEENQILPIGVLLELLGTAVDGPSSILAGEDAD